MLRQQGVNATPGAGVPEGENARNSADSIAPRLSPRRSIKNKQTLGGSVLEPVVDRFAKAESKDGRVNGLQLEGDVCHSQALVTDAYCDGVYGCFGRGLRFHTRHPQASTAGDRRHSLASSADVAWKSCVLCWWCCVQRR